MWCLDCSGPALGPHSSPWPAAKWTQHIKLNSESVMVNAGKRGGGGPKHRHREHLYTRESRPPKTAQTGNTITTRPHHWEGTSSQWVHCWTRAHTACSVSVRPPIHPPSRPTWRKFRLAPLVTVTIYSHCMDILKNHTYNSAIIFHFLAFVITYAWTVLYIVLYYMALYYIIWHCIKLYCIVLHYIVYYIVLYVLLFFIQPLPTTPYIQGVRWLHTALCAGYAHMQ